MLRGRPAFCHGKRGIWGGSRRKGCKWGGRGGVVVGGKKKKKKGPEGATNGNRGMQLSPGGYQVTLIGLGVQNGR